MSTATDPRDPVGPVRTVGPSRTADAVGPSRTAGTAAPTGTAGPSRTADAVGTAAPTGTADPIPRSTPMSAPTDSTVLTSARTPATGAAPRTAAAPSAATRTLHYAAHSTRMTVTNVVFMVFTIALPVGMYLLFSTMFGEQGGGQARGMIMVNMAAYGGLGAAVTAGTQIQEDQRNGFLRQLIVAGLSPRSFLVGSVIAASAVIVPALVAVGLVGLATGVDVGMGPFVATIVVLWAGLLPTILVGIVLGMVLKGGAAMAGGVVTMMAMAIFGGLWMPLEMFPAWMQTLGQFMPTYWIAQLGEWSMYGSDLPLTGLLVIGVWTLVLGLLCAASLRRAVGLKRR